MSTTTVTSLYRPTTIPSSPILASPIRKKSMSITQTYYLAHKARAKLSHEAAMGDHNLRLLVGHANLLDSLMLELADAEREQESWFNQSVRSASQPEKKGPESNKHIHWADTIAEEEEDDDDDEEYAESGFDEDESSDEDEDVKMADAVSLRRVTSHNSLQVPPPSPRMETVEVDMQDSDEEYDDEEDYAELTLTRSPSHSLTTSPPELVEPDSDESSEDEAMPPSPPSTMLPTFEEKQTQKKVPSHQVAPAEFYDEGFYLPSRSPARLVSAISVY